VALLQRITSRFRGGRTVRLPPSGRAIVVSDLHGHVGDWRAFLASSRARERLLAGEDLWLILTGDVPDVARHRSVDPTVPADGDAVILDELIALKAELGDQGDRVLYLEGNHDFHLARIAREIVAFVGEGDGAKAPLPPLQPEWIQDYVSHYQESYGERIFQNNVAPYDMIHRVRPEHVAFIESSPILAHCEEAGILVTHAGPPRMDRWNAKGLRKAIDMASREQLRNLSAEEYYAAPYHQLLNNRFRNGDYEVHDLEMFLEAYGGGIMFTGHTPHPYLIDLDKREPLPDCGFRDGLGFVGGRQVVLCSSFGAFHPALKRYVEVDLTRRHERVEDLFDGQLAAQPIFPPGMPPPDVGALPGAEAILPKVR
jgi:hypothetical protein